MTEKELLYLDDALTQAKQLRLKCDNYADRMQDRELKAFVKELETRADGLFRMFFKTLQ